MLPYCMMAVILNMSQQVRCINFWAFHITEISVHTAITTICRGTSFKEYTSPNQEHLGLHHDTWACFNMHDMRTCWPGYIMLTTVYELLIESLRMLGIKYLVEMATFKCIVSAVSGFIEQVGSMRNSKTQLSSINPRQNNCQVGVGVWVWVRSSKWRSLSSAVSLHCTSKAGVMFFCMPKEREADRGSDVCAWEQTIVSQATPFAVRACQWRVHIVQWCLSRWEDNYKT